MKVKILLSLVITIGCLTINLNAQNKMIINQTLTPKQQSNISIAALTAKGDLSNLKAALNTGLEAGLSVNQIKGVLVHLCSIKAI